jgi:hypothetical protein
VHRTIRELVMTYFDSYYNVQRRKTLRSFTRPLNLAAFDRYDWVNDDATMFKIDRKLDALRRVPLLSPAMARGLTPVDERTYAAGLTNANPEGLFTPEK